MAFRLGSSFDIFSSADARLREVLDDAFVDGAEYFTVAEQEFRQPIESTTTVYIPEQSTLMHCVVAPVFHLYELNPAGAHKVVVVPAPGSRLPVMLQTGLGFTVTVLLLLVEHPKAVTVKE